VLKWRVSARVACLRAGGLMGCGWIECECVLPKCTVLHETWHAAAFSLGRVAVKLIVICPCYCFKPAIYQVTQDTSMRIYCSFSAS
jgi:hypothetical protein